MQVSVVVYARILLKERRRCVLVAPPQENTIGHQAPLKNDYSLAKTRPAPTQVRPGRSRREDRAVALVGRSGHAVSTEPAPPCEHGARAAQARAARGLPDPARTARPTPRASCARGCRRSVRAPWGRRSEFRSKAIRGSRAEARESEAPSKNHTGHGEPKKGAEPFFPCVTDTTLY